MSDNSTIARPYARAIFEHACQEKQLAAWFDVLNVLSQAICSSAVRDFLENPQVTPEVSCDLLSSLFTQASKDSIHVAISNLIELLVQNKRLLLLPEILAQYDALKAEHEKTLLVSVHSFTALTDAQQNSLIVALKARLLREIKLDVTIDESLIGGAVITAGDLVIDGSVRGKLHKLHTELVA